MRIERTRTIDGVTTTDVAYAITSLPPERADAAYLLGLDRGHWGIENRLHDVRDVTLGEDASRVRSGHAPLVYSMLGNVVLALVRHACPSHRGNVAATLRDLSWPPEAVPQLLPQPFSKN